MTVGIAVSGPGAARAALAGLAAVEAVGRGAIGGFVSLAALDPAGRLLTATVQRGGGGALAGRLPEGLDGARLAALMSSGPDRPEPLLQFTPADPKAGLVTGHRLPNAPGPDGLAPNLAALALLGAGETPEVAVHRPLAADPEADAGLIAVDLSGRIALANSAAVAARDDAGSGEAADPETGLRAAVLHNSIFPVFGLAEIALGAILDAANPGDRSDREASLIGVALRPGPARCLVLGPDGRPVAIQVAAACWLGPAWEGSAVRRGDPVLADGVVVGRVTREVYCLVAGGVVAGGRGGARVGWTCLGADVAADPA